MAKNVKIISTKDAFNLVIDGNEIEGVKNYSVSEDCTRIKVLTISIIVTGKVDVTATD